MPQNDDAAYVSLSLPYLTARHRVPISKQHIGTAPHPAIAIVARSAPSSAHTNTSNNLSKHNFDSKLLKYVELKTERCFPLKSSARIASESRKADYAGGQTNTSIPNPSIICGWSPKPHLSPNLSGKKSGSFLIWLMMQKQDERWSGDRREWLRATVSHTIRLKCNNAPCSADIYPRQGCQVVLLGKNSDLENTESCVRN